jgi:type 1 fimbria pilin
MKKVIVTLSLVLALSSALLAEKVTTPNSVSSVSGVVVDQTTGEALAGVAVSFVGSDQLVYTDLDGKFTFENVSVGAHALIVNYISYQKKVENLNVTAGNPNSLIIKIESQNE